MVANGNKYITILCGWIPNHEDYSWVRIHDIFLQGFLMSQTFCIIFMKNLTEAKLSQCVNTTAYFRQVSNFYDRYCETLTASCKRKTKLSMADEIFDEQNTCLD